MAQANATVYFYAYLNSVWTLLDDVQPASSTNGFTDDSPTTHVPPVGELRLILNNSTGQYSPDSGSALAGWGEGVQLKVVITYDGISKTHYYRVDEIQIMPRMDEQRVEVVAVDWFSIAMTYPIVNPSLLEDSTADDAITSLLADMPIQPQDTRLDTGNTVFPTIFDTVRGNTKAYAEFAKLANSELGDIFLERDGTLVFEASDYKNGVRELTTFPSATIDCDYIDDESGNYLDDESGNYLVFDDIESPVFSDVSIDVDVSYGQNIINSWTTNAYPKRVDTSSVQLYQTQKPIRLASGESKTFRVFFTNPLGNSGINAIPPTQDNYTVSLLHGEGSTDNSDIVDEMGNIWTSNGVTLTSAAKKFGERSLYFDGTTAYATTPHSSIWEVGGGDFTFRWWERRGDADNLSVVASRDYTDSLPAWQFGRADGTSSRIYMSSDGVTNDIANGKYHGAITLATWIFYEICRSGNNFYAFQNGVLTDSWTSSASLFASTSVMSLGRNVAVYLYAAIDEFSVLKGTALHTSAYTPPDAPFSSEGTFKEMWTLETLLGTDLTSYLTMSVTYGTEGATYTLTNTSSSTGYVRLITNGYGIYSDSSLQDKQESAASILTRGYKNATLQQAYQQDTHLGKLEGTKQVELNKDSRTVLNSISLCANSSPYNMQAFLNLDIGDLVHVSESSVGIDAWYYIQGIETQYRGLIFFKWMLKEAFTLGKGLTPMAVEFAGTGATDAIDFNYLPLVSGDTVTKRSFSAWINLDSISATYDRTILSNYTDTAGFDFYVDNHATNRLLSYYQRFVTSAGKWSCPSNSISLSTKTHVLVYYDRSSASNDPVIYINGVSQSLTEVNTPSGSSASEEGLNLIMGNFNSISAGYANAWDGKLEDVRVYDMDKTTVGHQTLAVGITAEGANGTGFYEGMVFHGPVVRDEDYTAYTDLTLTATTQVLESYNGYVGTPNGSPITRATF